MTLSPRQALPALVAGVALLLGPGGVVPAHAAPAGDGMGAERGGRADHRLVWDDYRAGRTGIHLRAARLRGSAVGSARAVYDLPHGFVSTLVLDRRGRRVAFAPCCRDAMPRIVVASLSGGQPLEPLETHPEFYAVSGIAWSPDGSRLAFEGFTAPGETLMRGLYSVRANGSGLEVLLPPRPLTEDDGFSDALAWTEEGVLYVEGQDVRVAALGVSTRVVVPAASDVWLSGDGSRLFTTRVVDGRRGLWRSRPDGTGLVRVADLSRRAASFVLHAVPDRRGRSFLGVDLTAGPGLDPAFVRWRAGRPPATATPIDVPAGSGVATWY